jgi:hypothetical protein
MERPFEGRKARGPIASRLLALDAWIDSSVWNAGFRLAEFWESLTIFFRRFRLTGFRRALVELLSEGFTLGTVAAVLMLALAMPAFEATKGDWRTQGDFAVTFLDRYGNEIGRRGVFQLDSVPVDELPDHVVRAVLATEDRRFFTHHGIDVFGLARAMTENLRANSVVQGGSTLSQQLAKNLFLSNERTVERKIKEAFLSVWLEMNLSKKEILQLYLDRAYMGGGTFGIAAAADFYFGKSVKEVNLAEAAMLAGLFKAPARYAPHINLPAARARANEVLSNLVQGGFMTEGQVLSARLHPADIVDRGATKSPDYFLDWAFEQATPDQAPVRVLHLRPRRERLDHHLAAVGREAGFRVGGEIALRDPAELPVPDLQRLGAGARAALMHERRTADAQPLPQRGIRLRQPFHVPGAGVEPEALHGRRRACPGGAAQRGSAQHLGNELRAEPRQLQALRDGRAGKGLAQRIVRSGRRDDARAHLADPRRTLQESSPARRGDPCPRGRRRGILPLLA